MITSRKFYELFETKWLMQRQNPGSKSPYLQGFLLGFTGTIDISDALDNSEKGIIKLKIGNGNVHSVPVDFSTVDPKTLSVQDAVEVLSEALTKAGVTDCDFDSDDEDTKRLKLSPKLGTVKWVQIYGDLAAALQFGNCRLNEGKGCFVFASFDGDLKSAAETEQWQDDKTIENDSPRGTLLKFTMPGKRTGSQIVITDRMSSRVAKQMINGGRLTSSLGNPERYEPPTGANSEPGRVDVFTYSEIYNKNENTIGDEVYIRERMYIGCIGKQNRTGGAGNWSDSEYTLTAVDYVGEDGKDYSSPVETDFSQAQWDALQMSDIIVADWETA